MSAGKASVAVVTDSTADLPLDIKDRYGISAVPLNVMIDGRTWLDGQLSQQEFFERMHRAARLPTTSQPSVGAFVDEYAEALERADHVASIHISNELSGTIDSARQAAERFAGSVTVFDSRNLSWGLGFQVIEAAKRALEGETVESVIEAAAHARDRVQMLVGLDSLDNLVKGGRVGRVAGFVGGMLNLKVTLTVEDGSFSPVSRVRGTKAALAHTVDWVEDHLGDAKRAAFCVLHAMAPDRAARLEELVRERFEVSELHVVETGAVIATHTGVGWAVAFLPEE